VKNCPVNKHKETIETVIHITDCCSAPTDDSNSVIPGGIYHYYVSTIFDTGWGEIELDILEDIGRTLQHFLQTVVGASDEIEEFPAQDYCIETAKRGTVVVSCKYDHNFSSTKDSIQRMAIILNAEIDSSGVPEFQAEQLREYDPKNGVLYAY